LVQAIRQDHAGAKEKFTVQKTSFYYRGKNQTAYTYFANRKIKAQSDFIWLKRFKKI
jgi:hypothetical protein